MLLVSLIGATAFITLVALAFASADNYTAFEQTVMEFLVAGRIPGTNMYFDFDALIAAVVLLLAIILLTNTLLRQVHRRLVSDYADRIGI